MKAVAEGIDEIQTEKDVCAESDPPAGTMNLISDRYDLAARIARTQEVDKAGWEEFLKKRDMSLWKMAQDFFAFLFFPSEPPSESLSSLLLPCLPFPFFREPDPYTYSLTFWLVPSSVESSASFFGFQMKMDLHGQNLVRLKNI